MGTASTMACLAEAMGLALAGNGTIAREDAPRHNAVTRIRGSMGDVPPSGWNRVAPQQICHSDTAKNGCATTLSPQS